MKYYNFLFVFCLLCKILSKKSEEDSQKNGSTQKKNDSSKYDNNKSTGTSKSGNSKNGTSSGSKSNANDNSNNDDKNKNGGKTAGASKSSDDKKDSKLDVKVKDDEPEVIVKTEKDWDVNRFELRRSDDELVKDLTSEFKEEYDKEKGGDIKIDYGKLKISDDYKDDEYRFTLLTMDGKELKSSKFKYDDEKEQLSGNGDSDDDDDDDDGKISWWWLILVFVIAVVVVGLVVYLITNMNSS